MLPIIGWRVYCADGSTYERDPQNIPAAVQVVIYFHEYPFRTIASGDDEYEVDGVTLYGLEISEADYYALFERAYADMDWPR
jgi:hypothetical protein